MKTGSATLSGQTIHWQAWGDENAKPVIALHGWLDNCATFVRLAPQLRNMYVVAIDMPGHGLSDHRPWPGNYNIWDDLIDIVALADHFGWQKFSLLGHSRGAIIAALLAASLPKRVDKLMLLDGIVPWPAKPEETAQQLGKYVEQHLSRAEKFSPTYDEFNDAMVARCKAADMTELTATPILERGLVQGDDNKWRWRSDPRLTMNSAVRLTLEQIRGYVGQISCPAMLLLANDGLIKTSTFGDLMSQWDHIETEKLPGSHHFHLEPIADDIAARINAWF